MSGKELSPDPTFDPEELGFQLAAHPVPRLHQTYGAGFHYPSASIKTALKPISRSTPPPN